MLSPCVAGIESIELGIPGQLFSAQNIHRERERERESQSQRVEEGRKEGEQRGRDKGQRRKESLLQWFLDSFPTPSSLPLKAALCCQGKPIS